MNIRPALASLLLAGLGFLAPALADTQATPATIVNARPAFTVEDLLLLEVYVGDQQLTDALGAYSSRRGVFLPLGELARLLDLPILVDPPARAASGWFLAESRTFALELDAQVATSEGRETRFGPADAVLFDGEIYVRAELLEKLLPMQLVADLRSMSLEVRPRERLPFQDRLERDQRRRALSSRGGEGVDKTLRVDMPYEWFTPPSADLNIQLGAASTEPRRTSRWELRLAGDLALSGMQAWVSSDDHGHPDSARLLFERREPARDGQGVIRSSAGDVFTPSLPLGAASQSGRGFSFSTEPAEQASVFDQVDLRGELPPGYEVELYVNEVLRSSQAAAIQGRYEFLKVPLTFGLNVVRLAFYGPRGERYEEVRRINVGGGQLAAGQTVVSAGIVEQGMAMFELQRPAVDPRLLDPAYGQLQYSVTAAHGLSTTLTARAGFAEYTPFAGDTRRVANFGLASAIGGFAAQLDYGRDDASGNALALGLAGRAGELPLVLRHVEYGGGFTDQLEPGGIDQDNPLSRASSLRSDVTLPLPGGDQSLPLSLEMRREQRQDHSTTWLASTRATAVIGNALASGSLDYERVSQQGGGTGQRMRGSVDASTLLASGWQLRGSLAFDAMPQFQASSAMLVADRNLSRRTALHLGVQQDLTSGGPTAFTLGTTWRLGFLDLTLGASYVTKLDLSSVGLQFSMGSLFDPLRRSYRAVRPGAAAGGALAVEAFVDENGDGYRQREEGALVGLGALGGDGPAIADDEGRLLVTGLGSANRATVYLQLDSIEDPYLLPPADTITLAPRPGRVAVAGFPLRQTGEATIRFAIATAKGGQRGLAALEVELVDGRGTVVGRARSDYDGVALFEGLPPGQYQARLESSQSGRLGLSLVSPVTVNIAASGGYAGLVEALVQVRR